MENRLLTVKQLTEYIPLADQTIYHMLSRHRKGIESFPIPVQRMGRKPYFKLSDVQKWIERLEAQHPNADLMKRYWKMVDEQMKSDPGYEKHMQEEAEYWEGYLEEIVEKYEKGKKT